MSIDIFQINQSEKQFFSSLCLKGKFDNKGNVAYTSNIEADNTHSPAMTLHDLFSDDEANEILKKITEGETSGNSFITFNLPTPRRFYWEYFSNKKDLYYSFRAYPVDDFSIINLLRANKSIFDLISSCPDLMIITIETGQIIYINPSGYEMLNLDNNYLEEHKNVSSLISNIDSFEELSLRLSKQKVIQEIELSFSRKNSKDILGLSSIFSISQQGKQFICFHVVDITERIKNFSGHMQNSIILMNLNEELKRSQSQLLNQEKMASIGQLSAGIAHELNNPLGYVFNNINVLFNHMIDIQNFINHVRKLYTIENCNSSQLEQIMTLDKNLDLDFIFNDLEELKEETREGVSRIKSIIDSLRSFSQKDSLMSYSSHNVNDSIKDTLVVLRNEYKYKIELTTDLGSIPDIFCNSYELNQAFLNIIKNSIDAINEDENLKTGLIKIRTFEDSNYVHVVIYNNGPKIPEQIKNRIFEPFFTTKSVGTGTGLGLSITHDIIVNKHNGDIKIDDLDQGVQFHISLPIVEELENEA